VLLDTGLGLFQRRCWLRTEQGGAAEAGSPRQGRVSRRPRCRGRGDGTLHGAARSQDRGLARFTRTKSVSLLQPRDAHSRRLSQLVPQL